MNLFTALNSSKVLTVTKMCNKGKLKCIFRCII